jgi:hypothetical protein
LGQPTRQIAFSATTVTSTVLLRGEPLIPEVRGDALLGAPRARALPL